MPHETHHHSEPPVTSAVDALLKKSDASYHAGGEVNTVPHEKTGMPQLDVSTFPSQILWLLIAFFLLYRLLAKSALPSIETVLEKRKSRIERDLVAAEKFSEDAAKAEHAYAEMHRRARETAAERITGALQAQRLRQEKELGQADAQVIALLQNAEAVVKERRKHFLEEMLPFAEGLAERLVQELTGKTPDVATLQSALASHRKTG